MQPFDLCRCELDGINLVEASAGTGKTHALTGLFLRLIVEKDLTPPQILVITYTNAATGELKKRIRDQLIAAQRAFQGEGGDNDDELLTFLAQRYSSPAMRKTVLQRIRLALADYDETAIHTIHGFCDRVLRENAFEGGTLFDAEIIANEQSLVSEFVSDFWRKHLYENHPLLVQYALAKTFRKERLFGVYQNIASKPDLRVFPESYDLNGGELEKPYESLKKLFEEFKSLWEKEREDILALLRSPALKKNIYGQRVEVLAAQTDALASLSEPVLPLPDFFVRLTATNIRKSTKTQCAPPDHRLFNVAEELFNQCRELEALLNSQLIFLQRKFIDAVLHDLPSLKKRKNVLCFNDLLFGAREALKGPRGQRLRQTLRERYKAVLVDEFQDTDPIQYDVLDDVFVSGRNVQETAVFYVGDPKQAIYAFRGADVFAYLKAARAATRRYTMMKNWRSEEGLLRAVNAIFSSSDHPFVYEDIRYISISGAEKIKTRPLLVDGRKTPAMRILFLPSGKDGEKQRSRDKTEAAEIILSSVVNEIVRLLRCGRENRLFIGEKPVQESDIAVLVRTNRQAADFQKALHKAGISTTLHSSQSVFHTLEAQEMKRFLWGVVHPDDDGILLAALATPLIGFNAELLGRCLDDDALMESWREKFRQAQGDFIRGGFLTMFYDFLEEQHRRPKILTYPDGLRKITNYLHLAEEIHHAQREENLNMNAVLRWFDAVLEDDSEWTNEHQQLRLEDDRNAVHLVTIHKSKGLEYSIVFCPFVWAGAKVKPENDLCCFHDEDHDRVLTCDLHFDHPENYLAQWRKENLAEEARLLYVALTRAKNRCYAVWGNIKDVQNSALWHVLHGRRAEESSKELQDEQMLERLEQLVAEAPGAIEVSVLQPPSAEYFEPLRHEKEGARVREFSGCIDLSWKIASYSYLTGMKKQFGEDLPFIEEENVFSPERPLSEEKSSENMFSFPRGPAAGSLLHEILKSTDFSSLPYGNAKNIIHEKLRKYNFEEKWESVVFNLITDLSRTNLENPLVDLGQQSSLDRIDPSRCLKEMAFTFPVSNLSLIRIIDLLQNHQIIDAGKKASEIYTFNINQLRGFFKGFIDMVFEYENRFYLLDWKSNYLGDRYEDYSTAIIHDYMKSSSYVLQYLIYTVALDKYLRAKVKNYSYENHFGGVYYVFLRGIGANAPKNNGIYFDRLSSNLLEQLRGIFHP